MSRKDFHPKVSIVTGGASGIGRAIASELIARGSTVVIADIDGDAAARTAAELGSLAESATLDVTDHDAVTALVRRVAAEHGRLDVMVNNAGIALGGLLEELDHRHWDRGIAVNLRGVVNGVVAAYEVMREQGSGHILNTASLAGLIPAPAMLPYTTTKHAVVGMSSALRAEAAGLGIRVSVLCPGFVDTPLLDQVYEAPESFEGGSVRSTVKMIQPKFLTAELVGQKAVDGLAANKAVIPVGSLAQVMWRVNRVSPSLARAMCRVQVAGHRRLRARAAQKRGVGAATKPTPVGADRP